MRAERERDEKSAFFEAVANVAGDLVLVIDTQGKIVYQNEALKKIRRGRGFADEQSWGQLIHPDDLELTRAAVAQGLAGAPRSALQYRVAGPGGGWRVLQANTQPILDDQGQPQFLAAVAIDITDQLEQEKKLRQMEIAAARADADQRLGAVLSQGVLGVAEVDLNGIIRSANQALCRLTGYTKDELIGRNWTLFYRPEDQAEFNQRLAVAARGESVEPVRREFLRADRTVGWWIGTIVGISDSQGAPLGAYMLMFDAAAQAQAENALAESEELYRLITDNQSELVQMTDREGKVLFESPSVSRLRAASDLRSSLRLGDPRTTLIHPDDVRIAMEAVAEIFRDRKPITMELRQMLPSGQIRWVEANGQPFLGPDGEDSGDAPAVLDAVCGVEGGLAQWFQDSNVRSYVILSNDWNITTWEQKFNSFGVLEASLSMPVIVDFWAT
ncbi:MAG: PAS domain-containing protein, partial [Quisquiliibacterium sp.]